MENTLATTREKVLALERAAVVAQVATATPPGWHSERDRLQASVNELTRMNAALREDFQTASSSLETLKEVGFMVEVPSLNELVFAVVRYCALETSA